MNIHIKKFLYSLRSSGRSFFRKVFLRIFPHNKPYVNIVLILLTIGSTYLVGGPWYCIAIMTILLSHEMGHYLMCRKYGVHATLPFVIPMPFTFFGTMGAVIVMKSPIPSRKALFDIGVAGPLAGLIVAIPAIYYGIQHSEIVEISELSKSTIYLGESLLFKWVSNLAIGPLSEGYDVNIHPLAYAGWTGLFVTALNLLPIGQLDGGHVMYALFGPNAKRIFNVSLAGFAVCTFYFPGWALLFALLLFFGYKHPPPLDDFTPLDLRRKLIGVLAFVIFITSFTPVPFKF